MGTTETINVQTMRLAICDTVGMDSILRPQSNKGMGIMPCDGPSQVAKVHMQGISSESCTIRHAVISDCELYWYWSNNPEVRSNAFNQDSISWEDHHAWYNQKLQDSGTILIVVESVLGPVGQVSLKDL